jgi:hypothetical protein
VRPNSLSLAQPVEGLGTGIVLGVVGNVGKLMSLEGARVMVLCIDFLLVV